MTRDGSRVVEQDSPWAPSDLWEPGARSLSAALACSFPLEGPASFHCLRCRTRQTFPPLHAVCPGPYTEREKQTLARLVAALPTRPEPQAGG